MSKIASLTVTSALDNYNYPSRALIRRLLNIMPKLIRLSLPYEYLLELVHSPLLLHILKNQLESLTILFKRDPPSVKEIDLILKSFSKKLRFLYINVDMTFPADQFYAILPLILDNECIKLYHFYLELYFILRAPQSFSTEFQSWLQQYLTELTNKRPARMSTMEYGLNPHNFKITF